MPLFFYLCSCGLSSSKFFRVVASAPLGITCKCGLEMKKQLKGPSNNSVIIVDNVIQSKATEVDLAVVASNEENSTKDFREKP